MPIPRSTGLTFVHQVVLGGKVGTAPEAGPWSWHAHGTGESLVRPVGVAVSPVDGALYISSDNGAVLGTDAGGVGNGAIYRVGLKQ